MEARLKEVYKSEVAPQLMKKFGYKSVMQIPKLDKIVIQTIAITANLVFSVPLSGLVILINFIFAPGVSGHIANNIPVINNGENNIIIEFPVKSSGGAHWEVFIVI